MTRFLVLGCLTVASVSLAAPSRLVPQPSMVTLMTPEVQVTQPTVTEPHVPTMVASGMFAGLLSMPIALIAGSEIGKLSNNLYAALIPSLLTTLLLPPLAVVITEWVVAERSGKGRFRLIPTLLVTIVAQAAIMAAGIFLGANGTSGGGIAILTLASTVVLPTVATAMLKGTERPPVVVPVLNASF